jgi:hypothetical protein
VKGPTVIAVDWSGAHRPKGIWLAAVREGEVVESRPLPSRETAIEAVIEAPPPVVAGFDFSFSVPEWFAHELGCHTIDDVWASAARDGDAWLRPTPPFWTTTCNVVAERRLRRCEARLGATSLFALVGAGQVGKGAVRGMPLLPKLRAAGFSIWPFDAAGQKTALEIYPRVLRPFAPPDAGPFASNDERDAVCSALVLWDGYDEITRLRASADIEGDIWTPAAVTRSLRSRLPESRPSDRSTRRA